VKRCKAYCQGCYFVNWWTWVVSRRMWAMNAWIWKWKNILNVFWPCQRVYFLIDLANVEECFLHISIFFHVINICHVACPHGIQWLHIVIIKMVTKSMISLFGTRFCGCSNVCNHFAIWSHSTICKCSKLFGPNQMVQPK
jgi:hypothetical protein